MIMDVSMYKKIADAEQHLMEYTEAIVHIKIFLEHPDIVGQTRLKAQRFLTSLEFAEEAVQHPCPSTRQYGCRGEQSSG